MSGFERFHREENYAHRVDTSDLQFPDGLSLDDIVRAMRKPSAPIGTNDNPYVVIVPKWFEERRIAEGTTPQEVGDKMFRYATRVEVLEDY